MRSRRRSPTRINFASPGVGTPNHLGAELLKVMTGFQFVHVPYKGGGPAVVDLIAGRAQALFGGIPYTGPHVKAGRLRAIAIGHPLRLSVVARRAGDRGNAARIHQHDVVRIARAGRHAEGGGQSHQRGNEAGGREPGVRQASGGDRARAGEQFARRVPRHDTGTSSSAGNASHTSTGTPPAAATTITWPACVNARRVPSGDQTALPSSQNAASCRPVVTRTGWPPAATVHTSEVSRSSIERQRRPIRRQLQTTWPLGRGDHFQPPVRRRLHVWPTRVGMPPDSSVPTHHCGCSAMTLLDARHRQRWPIAVHITCRLTGIEPGLHRPPSARAHPVDR